MFSSFGVMIGFHFVSLGVGKPPSFPQRQGSTSGPPFCTILASLLGPLWDPLGDPWVPQGAKPGRQGSPKRGLETECRQLDKQKDAQSQMVAQRELEDHEGVTLLSVVCHVEAPL